MVELCRSRCSCPTSIYAVLLPSWRGQRGVRAVNRLLDELGVRPEYERVLGRDHPATLTSRNDLAYA